MRVIEEQVAAASRTAEGTPATRGEHRGDRSLSVRYQTL